MPRTAPRAAALVVLAVAAGLLAGCVAEPVDTPPAPSASPSASPPATASPSPPAEFVPDGTASDNLPYFAEVVATVWASPENVSGRAYIDALVAAGFPKEAMEVTPDTSTVGNPAESIQFAVAWQAECLIGQVGPATGDPVAQVMPGLAEGGCLIGRTRPIDW